jgi:thymidylate synthase (FAD)
MKVKIQDYTYKKPITMIGHEAGVCWHGKNTPEANYKRGLDCLESQHGRTFEFPDIYLELDENSARVIREWYTHIGGSPTRLQDSTRYIDMKDFKFYTPDSIRQNKEARKVYSHVMNEIANAYDLLEHLGIPKEECAYVLPLSYETKIVCKINLRTFIEMCHQRLCSRALKEYRELMHAICKELALYSEEWAYLDNIYFVPKCKYLRYCPEKKSCKE